MKHTHFDIEETKKRIEAALSVNDDLLDDPGVEGAQARIMRAVLGTFTLSCIEEMNRGTNDADIQCGIAAVLANMVISWVKTLTGREFSQEEMLICLNSIMGDIYFCLGRAMNRPDLSTSLPAMKGGSA